MALLCDSYKIGHWSMYPPVTEYIGSYLESRVGAEIPWTVFFGLQYIIKRRLLGKVLDKSMIDEAEELCKGHFGQNFFNRKGWEYILNEYDGHLPVSIKAVPEGTVVPTSNVLMKIENTDPRCYWLTNHLETMLVQLWEPCTIATTSRHMGGLLKDALEESGSVEKLPFMLHDFGYRGSFGYVPGHGYARGHRTCP